MSDVDCINCKYNSHDRDKLPCVLCDDSSNWEYRGAPEKGVSQGSSRRVEHLKQERDEARVMVLRLVVARYRQGLEQGDSEEEVHDLALSKLGGWELDPCNNRSECEKILGFKIEDPE